jgi:hypothetical protein
MGFAEAESDENLKASVFKVAFERNEGTGAAFFDLTKEPDDFGMVKEQFALTIWFRVGPVTMAIGGDMEGVEPGFTIFDTGVGVGEIATASTDGFDFRTRQNNPGLNGLGNRVVMTGLAVMNFDRFQGS